ncbi:UNVERIFIED_CONTAM: hypothetical protein Slati_0070800 [Sesamum latifolium]|uniref:Reverse transcriptase domain-containing protein n=1 Tax=Sesamum latifolium TaxID=2727402 RepID=A0AAW2Y7V3_9LAMI
MCQFRLKPIKEVKGDKYCHSNIKETVWRQRCKELWLREGDRNTGYFHRRASQRFKVNSIRKIRESSGQWVVSKEGIQRCIEAHFREVYASSRPLEEHIAEGMEHLHSVVDTSIVEDLLQPYTALEVSKALFQMAPQKSTGPDDRIISHAQSAFVPGWLISDNILLAFELNHFLNTKTKGGSGWMALKLEVNKAYDKVEWSFLEQRHLAPSFTMLNVLGSFAVCRAAPAISHLLFADDTLIFCQASLECVSTVKGVLETYRKVSGQEINFSKSSVAFSRNTLESLCLSITTALSIRKENKMELYLGLPSRVARSKRELFGTIRDRIWNKITSWHEKLLSQAGKQVLIQSVIQAIPSYTMGCFKLPGSLLKEIHTKQLWRIMRYPDRLLSRVLKARYFPNGDIFSATAGRRPSFTWRSLMAAHSLFHAGCRRRVGSGELIHAWSDSWLPRPRTFRPITPCSISSGGLYVSELMDPVVGEWDAQCVHEVFWPEDS